MTTNSVSTPLVQWGLVNAGGGEGNATMTTTVEPVISETVSEKRRGRRSKDSELIAALAGLWPEVTTRRGLQNKVLLARSMSVIGETCPWLCNAKRVRQTILFELGHIGDDDALLRFAKLIDGWKPKAAQAVAWIRRWRLGETPANASALHRRIVRCIDVYRRRHHDLTQSVLLDALELTRQAFVRALAEDRGAGSMRHAQERREDD